MAVQTNYAPNPNFTADIFGYDQVVGVSGCSAWWDQTNGLTLRINNTVSAYYARRLTVSLKAGTYHASSFAQVLSGTTDVMFAARKQGTTAFLVEQHWTAPNNSFTRKGGAFTLTTDSVVEFLFSVGSPSKNSAGSVRFDKVLITEGSAQLDYFDGDSVDTDAIIYAWSGTANRSASTATPVGDSGGGGETPPATPENDGWELIEANDFTTATSINTQRFYIYDGFKGTNQCGTYSRNRVYLADGKLVLSPDGDTIPGLKSNLSQRYGKWETGVKWNARGGYKYVMFLWPTAREPKVNGKLVEYWSDGEFDYFECIDSSGNSFAIFFHNSAGNPAKNQAFNTHVPVVIDDVIKKISMEWYPESARVLVNDVVVFETDDPAALMKNEAHWVGQMDVGVPNAEGKSPNGVGIRPSYPTKYTGDNVPNCYIEYLNIYALGVGTTSPPAGGGGNDLSLGFVEAPTDDQDAATMRMVANLEINEPIVHREIEPTAWGSDEWGESIWPSGLDDDDATLISEHMLEAVESAIGDMDTALLTVPGRPELPGPVARIVVRRDRWIWMSKTKGKQIELTGFVDDVAMMRGASGLFGPSSKITRSSVPGMPGAFTTDIRHDVRSMSLPLVEHAKGYDASLELITKMVGLMDPVTNDAVLRYIAKDGHVSELSAQVSAGLEGRNIGNMGPQAQDFDITIEAEDPYWYREPITLPFVGSEPTDWFPIWRDDGEWLSSSSVIGTVSVTTKSDVPTWPQWSIVGPGSNPELINSTTRQTLALLASLDPRQTIQIDTRDRGPTAKTVKGPDGSNWFGRLTAHDIWALQPGRNDLEIVVVGAEPQTYVALTYRDATLMP